MGEIGSSTSASLTTLILSGLPSVPIFPGQSRFLDPVPGVPANGKNIPIFRERNVDRKDSKIALIPPYLNLEIPKCPGEYPRTSFQYGLFNKKEKIGVFDRDIVFKRTEISK